MLIRKPEKIRPSEITDERFFHMRRSLLVATLGLGTAAALPRTGEAQGAATSPVGAQLSKRLLEGNGLARFHLLDALAKRGVQLGAVLVIEVVPVVSNLEWHHTAFGQVGGLVQREPAVLDLSDVHGWMVSLLGQVRTWMASRRAALQAGVDER